MGILLVRFDILSNGLRLLFMVPSTSTITNPSFSFLRFTWPASTTLLPETWAMVKQRCSDWQIFMGIFSLGDLMILPLVLQVSPVTFARKCPTKNAHTQNPIQNPDLKKERAASSGPLFSRKNCIFQWCPSLFLHLFTSILLRGILQFFFLFLVVCLSKQTRFLECASSLYQRLHL